MSWLALLVAIITVLRVWDLPSRLAELREELKLRQADQNKLQAELQRLRDQVAQLLEASGGTAATEAPEVALPPSLRPRPAIVPVPLATLPVAPAPAVPPAPVPVPPAERPALVQPPVPALPAERPAPALPPVPAASPTPVPLPTPAALPKPVSVPAPVASPEPVLAAVPVAAPAAPVARPPVAPPLPPRRPVPPPKPVRTGPTWWERAATLLLENWTGILGAVVLVTGVGFLGIYTALRLAPPYRFLLICAFAVGLLGARFALREKAFARQLNAWLLSSSAAIFLFACVGAVSIPGLRWVLPPFDYLLLLAGVSANLYLAWRTSREEVATLHGVLSLVALAVLPPTALTLGAAAGVTAFSIVLTYRQLWKYQLLLSIISFFAFHLYWHQAQPQLSESLRLTAIGLVLLVGGAAAVVQYRSVYARRRFEPLLFSAHLLNWTCLGISLYLNSTGSVYKTIPLGLGALLTFWAGRRAKQLGIGWLFQTDTIISLLLALATALSLQGWHATPAVIGLFMLLESLLVALIMARQSEALVYRVALAGALLAGAGLLVVAGSYAPIHPPAKLYRDALVLLLAGWAGIAFAQLIFKQPLLLGTAPAGPSPLSDAAAPANSPTLGNAESHRHLLSWFAGLAGLLQMGTGLLLAHVVFGWANVPVAGLLLVLVALAGGAIGLANWVRAAGLAPDWVRRQQLVLGQFFAVIAVFGLHEVGLSWPVVLLILYAETLLAVLLLARRDSGLHRAALAGGLLAGTSLLLAATSHLATGGPALLYRDALLLAVAGGASLTFMQVSLRQLAALPVNVDSPGGTASTLHYTLLHGFAGLAGLLQVGTGLVLARVVFGWANVPVVVLLLVLVALAGAAIGLARWVRLAGLAPDWVRRQQLVLGQFFAVVAIIGLHELRLSWPGVLLVLYIETLLAVLLLARRDAGLHRVALGSGLLTGVGLLLLAVGHVATGAPVILYRDALLLAVAGASGLAFAQASFQQFAGQLPTSRLPAAPEPPHTLLGGLAGLAGLLQAGTGLLLARALFGWAHAPVLLLLGALLALAGLALGGALWVRAAGLAPGWVHRQQLVVSQGFVVLAVFGLHELGLSWPGVVLVLYAENLLAALLLSGRDEDGLLHTQTYLLVLQALLLPLLVRYTSPGALLSPVGRAALLVGAALLTLGYQLRRHYWRRAQEELARLALGNAYQLPLLGLAVGWLLLGAGALVYAQQWAAWAMVALLGSLLYLRQRVAAPGLWAGLALAAVGYLGLQWHHALSTTFTTGYVTFPHSTLGVLKTLLYLLPTVAVPLVGLATSWWAAAGRYVRWPWLYLLGAHLVVAVTATATLLAYFTLGLLGLAALAFAATQRWRRTLPDAVAVARAGRPDRYLLHLAYGLLLGSLGAHLSLPALDETLFGQPAEYFTAALLFALLVAMAVARPPATEPVYRSWRVLHPWLPEAALLFGSATLAHNVRAPWLPLLWVGGAITLSYFGPGLSLRFRRLAVYGRLYYWLAALTVSLDCLLYVVPGYVLQPEWWALVAAVALLFGYVGLALRTGGVAVEGLSPAWDALARPTRRQLEATLLYPAFGALSLFFVESFDRSVLTVLLMLEVVAVFSTSLLLRRQDLRYVSLAGMLGCLVRLVFFDLSRSGTITRAIVFIFMGLLLLGMNALYARFKSRFADPETPDADDDRSDEPLPETDEDAQPFLP